MRSNNKNEIRDSNGKRKGFIFAGDDIYERNKVAAVSDVKNVLFRSYISTIASLMAQGRRNKLIVTPENSTTDLINFGNMKLETLTRL